MIFLPEAQIQLNKSKSNRHIPIRDHSTKHLTSTSENCQDHKKTQVFFYTITDQRTLRQKNQVLYGIPDWILEQKK